MDYLSRFGALYDSLYKSQEYKKPNHITILDGGMGTALFNRGVPKSPVVWSAISLIKPEYHATVIKCHEDYLRAGAHVLTTNNYAVQPFYYMEYFGPEKFQQKIEEHTVLAAQLCRFAVQNCKKSGELKGRHIQIAGCIPPCRESLRPDLTNAWLREPENYARATKYYRHISTLLEPFVDSFVLETVNSLVELRCMLGAMRHIRKPITISMQGSFLNEKTMFPEPWQAENVCQFILNSPECAPFKIQMFSLNCAHPDHIEEALLSLSENTRNEFKKRGIKLGAYANSVVKEAWDPENAYSGESVRVRDSRIKSNYVRYALRWNHLGVDCIGGCCGVGKEEIKNVAEYFNCPVVGSPPSPADAWMAGKAFGGVKTKPTSFTTSKKKKARAKL